MRRAPPAEPDRLASASITAAELAQRAHRPTGALDGAALEKWLLEAQLATNRAGRLQLTALVLEFGGAIR